MEGTQASEKLKFSFLVFWPQPTGLLEGLTPLLGERADTPTVIGLRGYRAGWPTQRGAAGRGPAAAGPHALRAQAAVSKPNPRARAVRHLGAAPGLGRAKPPSPNRFWFSLPLRASDPAGGGGGEHSLGEKKGGPLWGSVSASDSEAQGIGAQGPARLCVSDLGKTPPPVSSSIKWEK